MTRVLVTGATGFLGGAIARELHRRGVGVVATGRDERKGVALTAEGIAFHAADLSSSSSAASSLVGGCDSVVHSAALTSPWGHPDDFLQANVVATRHLLAACDPQHVRRFLHISSPSVLFAFQEQPDLKEDAPWEEPPANDYIATKREVERAVMQAAGGGLDAIMLRPKALFGPGDTTLLPRLMRVAQRGFFPLFGEGDPLMDLTWIDDAVRAVVAGLEAGPELRGRTYHITSGDPQPRETALRTLFDSAALKVRFRRVRMDHALKLATVFEGIGRVLGSRLWEPPLTRYSVGTLAYPQTLDLSAARRDLAYHPKTNVLARLAECGRAWRQATTKP